MKQRPLEVIGMLREQRRGELDRTRTISDAAGDGRQPAIVQNPVRAEHPAEILRVQPRENELQVSGGRQSWCGVSGSS